MTGRRQQGPRGRGAASNPLGRFERLEVVAEGPLPGRVPTVFLRDSSRTILVRNESPDVPFDVSINPYRGCEHGCAYCYARPTHEYLGFSAGLDFETKILVKETAPELLAEELESPRWRPEVLGISGVTDPYQPAERRLELTRRCLEVLALYRNPVALITKNHLVTRDADLLAELARHRAAAVVLSITTLDEGLTRTLEPRTSHPRDRLRALEELSSRRIPCGVLVAPIIPGLNDHEIPSILEAAAEAGAGFASFIPLRLPGAVAGLFEEWLERHLPDRRRKVLNRVRSTRGGKLNDPRFGSRMQGTGVFADQIRTLFETSRRRWDLEPQGPELSTAAFRRQGDEQLGLRF